MGHVDPLDRLFPSRFSDLVKLLLRQRLYPRDRQELPQSLLLARRRHEYVASSLSPLQQDLTGRDAELLSDALHGRVDGETGKLGERRLRRVSGDGDVMRVAEVDDRLLCRVDVRM